MDKNNELSVRSISSIDDQFYDSTNLDQNYEINYTLLNQILESDPESDREELIRNIILIMCYSIIVIVSLIGNILVCCVVFSHKSTTTNRLIGNLAVSDLLMTTLNIPFNIARMILDNWPFGQTLCIIMPFVQSSSAHCSSFTMMVIALERYRRLINVSHISCRSMSFTHIVAVIWLVSALFSLPHGIYNRVEQVYTYRKLIRCRVSYPEPKLLFRQWLTLISLSIQYVMPISITCAVYVRIGVFLWKREIVGTINECRRVSLIKRKIRRIKMLIMVVAVFTICWLPLNIYIVLSDLIIINYRPNLFFICHWFAMSSVCYNPFIYCWLNDKFRAKVINIFGCVRQRNQNHVLSESAQNDTLLDQIRLQPFHGESTQCPEITTTVKTLSFELEL